MARYPKSWTLATLVAACVLFLLRASAAAQTRTGTVTGRVTDINGGVIPGAVITVESPNLQGTQLAVTTGNGDYIFRLLPPGQYTLMVEAPGFAVKRTTFTLTATEPVKVDVTVAPVGVAEE